MCDHCKLGFKASLSHIVNTPVSINPAVPCVIVHDWSSTNQNNNVEMAITKDTFSEQKIECDHQVQEESKIAVDRDNHAILEITTPFDNHAILEITTPFGA